MLLERPSRELGLTEGHEAMVVEGFRWSRNGRILPFWKESGSGVFLNEDGSLVRNHTLDRGIVDVITLSFPLIKIEPCGPQGESEACRYHVPYCSAPARTGPSCLISLAMQVTLMRMGGKWQAGRAEHSLACPTRSLTETGSSENRR